MKIMTQQMELADDFLYDMDILAISGHLLRFLAICYTCAKTAISGLPVKTLTSPLASATQK